MRVHQQQLVLQGLEEGWGGGQPPSEVRVTSFFLVEVVPAFVVWRKGPASSQDPCQTLRAI